MPAARPTLVRQLAVILGIFVASCGPVVTEGSSTTSLSIDSSTTTSTPVPAMDDAATQLAEARGRWVASSPETYHFVLQDDCGECDPEWAQPRRIVVWDGTVLDPTRNDTDIEDLFSLLEAAVRDGRTVEAEYDPEMGHPTEIWIDREARSYDGGTHLIIHELAIGLPGDNVSLADLEQAEARWTEARPDAYEYHTEVVCQCPSDSTMWTLVEGERILDFTVEWEREPGALDPAPSTIEQLFADLHDLIEPGELVEAGARITGGAIYHPELGYPTWIGLDIEILDPDSELAELGPRLVFIVRDLEPHQVEASDFERARQQWFDHGPTDYRYELTIHDIVDASFGPPHLVEVAQGTVVSVTVDGEAVEPDSVPAYAIDSLFRQIEQWQADGWDIDVLYDQRLGHPVLVTAMRGDDSIVFSIEGFRPG